MQSHFKAEWLFKEKNNIMDYFLFHQVNNSSAGFYPYLAGVDFMK